MDKNISFEEALKKLESAVKKLESPEVELDCAIKLYEEAVALVGICNEKLNLAEQKVRLLTESKDGAVSDIPFGVGDEA